MQCFTSTIDFVIYYGNVLGCPFVNNFKCDVALTSGEILCKLDALVYQYSLLSFHVNRETAVAIASAQGVMRVAESTDLQIVNPVGLSGYIFDDRLAGGGGYR